MALAGQIITALQDLDAKAELFVGSCDKTFSIVLICMTMETKKCVALRGFSNKSLKCSVLYTKWIPCGFSFFYI